MSLSEPKSVEQLETLKEHRDRILALEHVMKSFAQLAIVISNAAFNLQAANRLDEAPGGYWVQGLQSRVAKPAHILFYQALAVYGPKRAEEEFLAEMKRTEELHILRDTAPANDKPV